ncbi:ubiquitin-like-conjugating enzyme ATG10 [Tubulanus polymorphus]|uniref:ubiquitin-like-conjugating enzyme ATG10 n=1 Tax=Tubulanus polymorphus TaxID=672921 RepID=UPI003DA41CEF
MWTVADDNTGYFQSYISLRYVSECTTKEKSTFESDKQLTSKAGRKDSYFDLDVKDTAELTSSESKDSELLTYEYHVLFSNSYSVPVLYFNIYYSDGKLVTLDKVWDYVPQEHREHLENEKWSMITQQEHPVLGRPFYQLHPCRTSELMGKLAADRNYTVTWLSAVGPIVGLNLPLCYHMLMGNISDDS